MNCADVRLDEYLDGELAEADRAIVDGHLASCAACRAELEQSRKLEKVLRSVPSGAAPDADHFVQSVRARSRRPSMMRLWGVAAAAVLLFGFVAILIEHRGPKPFDEVYVAVCEYSQKPSSAIEDDLRYRGPEALKKVESLLDHPNVRIQFAAASLLFKMADDATRNRVLSRFQQMKEPNGTWTLSEPGTDDSDVELVPVTVSMAGQDRWAMQTLQKLHRLNHAAQGKIVDSVVTLLHSTNVDIQRHALEIVKKLEIEFPLPAVIDLLDSPELGDEALRFLRKETRKDFGKDKEAWLKAIGGQN